MLSPEEEAQRRQAIQEALIQERLEGLEPDPVFFDYADRYARGEITIAEAIADYLAHIKAVQVG
jgi:Antitoxin VbhA